MPTIPRSSTGGELFAVSIGRVGDKVDRRVKAQRVDRATDLGNPYRLFDGSDIDRAAVCGAFGTLLTEMHVGRERLVAIGKEWGVKGEIGKWDGVKAQRMLTYLRSLRRTSALRLDCHCAPQRCHAESILRCLDASWGDAGAES